MSSQTLSKLARNGLAALGIITIATTTAPSLYAQARATVNVSVTIVAEPNTSALTASAITSLSDTATTAWATVSHPMLAANGLLQARTDRTRTAPETTDRPVRITLEYAAN